MFQETSRDLIGKDAASCDVSSRVSLAVFVLLPTG